MGIKLENGGFRMKNYQFIIFTILILNMACSSKKQKQISNDKVRFIVVEPQHFHAALVQKYKNSEVDSQVYVYADTITKAASYVDFIEQYNNRVENPTNWEISSYYGADFKEKAFKENDGNVVVLAGDNKNKIEFIVEAIEHNKDVFADKPLVINTGGYDKLSHLLDRVDHDHSFVYDIMTERYDVKNQILKALINNIAFSGGMMVTSDKPAISINSLHHFLKEVSGSPLIRPAMFYNTLQQGEGLVDVTTHYIDLVQWILSSEQVIDIEKDVRFIEAQRWKTDVSLTDFKRSTKLDNYPAYLESSVNLNHTLNVFSNGRLLYNFKGIPVSIAVNWEVESKDGKGDQFNALFETNNFKISIKADREGKSALFLKPNLEVVDFDDNLAKALAEIGDLPNLRFTKQGEEYRIIIPDELYLSHEEHFGKVLQQFLEYRKNRALPDWEKSFMLAKYYLSTRALKEAKTIVYEGK